MKKKNTISSFIFTLVSMLFFMYGIWVVIECLREINTLVASGTVNLKTDAFKVANYVLFDNGLASVIFYCLALFGLGKLLAGDEKAAADKDK